MSEESILAVQSILKGILNPDNKARNEAVAKLDTMRKNINLLLICLSKILHGKLFYK